MTSSAVTRIKPAGRSAVSPPRHPSPVRRRSGRASAAGRTAAAAGCGHRHAAEFHCSPPSVVRPAPTSNLSLATVTPFTCSAIGTPFASAVPSLRTRKRTWTVSPAFGNDGVKETSAALKCKSTRRRLSVFCTKRDPKFAVHHPRPPTPAPRAVDPGEASASRARCAAETLAQRDIEKEREVLGRAGSAIADAGGEVSTEAIRRAADYCLPGCWSS